MGLREMREQWRGGLSGEELHDLYAKSNIIWVIKSRRKK
jgi:hypothetical protein